MSRYFTIVVCAGLLQIVAGQFDATGFAAEPPPEWVTPMREVHARFRGVSGTCAHFGDSLTETLAYWSPLPHSRKGASPELLHAYEIASKRLALECWRDWKGPRFGNRSGAGIGWARSNVDEWLKILNPEVAIILFGTNDVGQRKATAYREDLTYVLQKCLKNGTVPILTTIPPRRDADNHVAEIIAVQRDLARALKIPLVDLHAEILRRRPADWDGGRLPPAGGQAPQDGHDVLTLIAADGVHLSHPTKFRDDYSAESLRHNGYALRTALSLLAYAEVVQRVFELQDLPVRDAVSPAIQPPEPRLPPTKAALQRPTAPRAPLRPSPSRSPALRFGTHYTGYDDRFRRAPRLTELQLPGLAGPQAIWGATGRDDAGNVYIGLTALAQSQSATLLSLPISGGDPFVLGATMDQLALVEKVHDRESQSKIHSKICQAADGAIYFTSMDEDGEAEDGSRMPLWGSHLWRIRPGEKRWEHVLKTPEALIALGSTGRYVYCLGYFNHVLYQFDTATGASRKVIVGSHLGHISRNLLVDLREHVYVPCVEVIAAPAAGDRSVSFVRDQSVRSSLVEFDADLREVARWPLPDYNPTHDSGSHGIVGFATLRTGQLVFATHSGALWCLTPPPRGPALLERLGWFHPDGPSYAAALYCPAGTRLVCGLAGTPSGLNWVVYDLENWSSAVCSLDPESGKLLQRSGHAIYGTNTIDERGRGYLVGNTDNSSRPIVLQIEWTP